MSTATDALLVLASALAEIPEGDTQRRELWANPLICSHALYAEAEGEADERERVELAAALRDGFIVSTDDVLKTRAALKSRAFYVNRAERRKRT